MLPIFCLPLGIAFGATLKSGLTAQDELHRRWAEAAGQSKASAAWSSSDQLSMAHQRSSIDALHDDPPMSQVQRFTMRSETKT